MSSRMSILSALSEPKKCLCRFFLTRNLDAFGVPLFENFLGVTKKCEVDHYVNQIGTIWDYYLEVNDPKTQKPLHPEIVTNANQKLFLL